MKGWLLQARCAGTTVSKSLALLGLLTVPGTVHGVLAQQVGKCVPAEAEAYLDVNNVRARIFNDGALFRKGNPYVYEVPKGEGVHALFAANLWIGGQVNGALRIASTLYGPFEFWPGPLDAAGHPPQDCTPYDRIFELRREDLEVYNETGIPPDRVVQWPWQWGAPVLDGDGVSDNYNLDGGDRPALLGDQMLWWVMNDAGNEHRFTQALGVEVRGTAFAVRAGNALGNVTFYRYKVTARPHSGRRTSASMSILTWATLTTTISAPTRRSTSAIPTTPITRMKEATARIRLLLALASCAARVPLSTGSTTTAMVSSTSRANASA